MTIISINTFNIGSTGKIMLQIAEAARKDGIDYYVAYPRARDNYKKHVDNRLLIGNRFLRNIHGVLSRITGLEGFFSFLSTFCFLKKVDKLHPDTIHLHNIHGSYINIPLLFRYIKRKRIRVVWTLHDCWSFTGRCPYFLSVKCDKWKIECKDCVYPKDEYPSSMIDSSRFNYHKKKKIFTSIDNLTIITPSKWLAELVGQSFLREHNIEVINNGINLEVFKPYRSTFREDHGISEEQTIILGVAFNWDYRKGLDIFVKLADILDSNYKIVLVGTNEETEKKLPPSIITIRRTENQRQLAEIYSSADVFVNPTREDNYPTVNMESIACGTPVISFRTGGSPEMINEECGAIVEVDDFDGLVNHIQQITTKDRTVNREACVHSAQKFDQKRSVNKYLEIYNKGQQLRCLQNQ